MKNKKLITLDDINAMMCPECKEVAEVVNSKENGKVLFNYGLRQLNAKNYKEAYRLFERGAEFGDCHCLHNLAVMLLNGHGCDKDYLKAVILLHEAYRNGNPDALYTLGWMHYDGYGVEQDYGKSYEMLSRAAEEGSQMAKEFWREMDRKESK